MTREQYATAEAYSIENNLTVMAMFDTGDREGAYAQFQTDALANPMSFDRFCEIMPRQIALHFEIIEMHNNRTESWN